MAALPAAVLSKRYAWTSPTSAAISFLPWPCVNQLALAVQPTLRLPKMTLSRWHFRTQAQAAHRHPADPRGPLASRTSTGAHAAPELDPRQRTPS